MQEDIDHRSDNHAYQSHEQQIAPRRKILLREIAIKAHHEECTCRNEKTSIDGGFSINQEDEGEGDTHYEGVKHKHHRGGLKRHTIDTCRKIHHHTKLDDE